MTSVENQDEILHKSRLYPSSANTDGIATAIAHLSRYSMLNPYRAILIVLGSRDQWGRNSNLFMSAWGQMGQTVTAKDVNANVIGTLFVTERQRKLGRSLKATKRLRGHR